MNNQQKPELNTLHGGRTPVNHLETIKAKLHIWYDLAMEPSLPKSIKEEAYQDITKALIALRRRLM